MKRFVLAGMAIFCMSPALAELHACADLCPMIYRLVSVADTKSYGLLLEAPTAGCSRLRYTVSNGRELLGRSPTLLPGGLAVVEIGRGFPAGEHSLTITIAGGNANCATGHVAIRRVTLGKASPDHGWMASD